MRKTMEAEPRQDYVTTRALVEFQLFFVKASDRAPRAPKLQIDIARQIGAEVLEKYYKPLPAKGT